MSPEILVAPLSLDQYWEAFWSNEAPYYIQAIIRDEEDSITRSTKWGPPEIYKELHGGPVLEERLFDKKIRNRVAFAPKFADSYAVFSVLEKTDTKLRIK